MIISIDLPDELAARLNAAADESGTDAQTILQDLVKTLSVPGALKRQKTPAEVLAEWKASGLTSLYARDPRDATVIARELRTKAWKRSGSFSSPIGTICQVAGE